MIKRLDEQARRLERHACGPSVEALMAQECARLHDYGGQSVFGIEPAPADTADGAGQSPRQSDAAGSQRR